MGTWGTKVFENDDALDWIYKLEQVNDLSLITNTLKNTVEPEDDYLEAPQACQALATAEIVAAMKGKPTSQLPEEAENWINHNALDTTGLMTLAIQAVECVKNSSELQELWEESDEINSWYTVLEDLIHRLKH